MDNLYLRIQALIESAAETDNLGALRAIDELIDVKLGERASKLSCFAGYLLKVFEDKHDPEVLVAASKILGHFARAGGATMADEVERQVWLVQLTLCAVCCVLILNNFFFIWKIFEE